MPMYEFLAETVATVMTAPCRAVAPEMTVGDLHRIFETDDVESFPVVRDGIAIGIVSKFDALRPFAFASDQIVPHYDALMGTTVEEIMTRDFVSVSPDTALTRVVQIMVRHRFKSLPVLDHAHHPLGMIAREDVFRALKRCTAHRPSPVQAGKDTACRHTA
jgi:CBS domain-containing protein